jgi:hypothetical protein
VAGVTYSLCENDKRLIAHSLHFMERAAAVAGGGEIWRENDDSVI